MDNKRIAERLRYEADSWRKLEAKYPNADYIVSLGSDDDYDQSKDGLVKEALRFCGISGDCKIDVLYDYLADLIYPPEKLSQKVFMGRVNHD